LIESGSSVSLNLKFGLFSIRSGYMTFKLFNDALNDNQYHSENHSDKLRAQSLEKAHSVRGDGLSYIGSMHRKDLSVATPSLAGTMISAN
jgi:hypothetical protein